MYRLGQAARGLSVALLFAAPGPAAGAQETDEFAAPPAAERNAVAALVKIASLQIDADYRVTSVTTGTNCTNEDLAVLADCERLAALRVNSPKVTDEGIAHLTGLTKLKSMLILSSGLSDEGIKAIRSALPGCSITTPGFSGGRSSGLRDSGSGSRGRGFGETPFGSGGFSSRTTSGTSLVSNSAVQDDLKLTPEQRQQIVAASDLRSLLKARDEKVAAVLTPPQQARLKQIQLQQAGSAVLLRADVASELKLSTDQQAAIRKLGVDAAATLRTATAELTQANEGQSRAELTAKVREKSAELIKQRDDQILAVLTEEQRQAWKVMLGPDGPKVTTLSDRTGVGGFPSRSLEAFAKAVFDRYDIDHNGTLTEAEFPETLRTRQSMARAGITLEFPLAREDFEKAYVKYAEAGRRRE